MADLRSVITLEDEQAVQANSNHPIWVNVDDKGRKTLDAVKLGDEITTDFPFLRTPSHTLYVLDHLVLTYQQYLKIYAT